MQLKLKNKIPLYLGQHLMFDEYVDIVVNNRVVAVGKILPDGSGVEIKFKIHVEVGN